MRMLFLQMSDYSTYHFNYPPCSTSPQPAPVFSCLHSSLSNLSLISWMGLEDKGRRGSSYILVTRCQALGLGGRRNGINTCWGKYIPSPRSPALEAGAKKSSRPFKWNKTGNYARQKQSIWWTFLAFQLCSSPQSRMLNWKRFCFVSLRVSLLSITSSPCRMLLIRTALLVISSCSLIKRNHLYPLFIVQLWRKGVLPFLSLR